MTNSAKSPKKQLQNPVSVIPKVSNIMVVLSYSTEPGSPTGNWADIIPKYPYLMGEKKVNQATYF